MKAPVATCQYSDTQGSLHAGMSKNTNSPTIGRQAGQRLIKDESGTSQQPEKTTGPSITSREGRGGRRKKKRELPSHAYPPGSSHVAASARQQPCHHGPTTPRSIDSHPLKIAPGVPAPALRPAYFVQESSHKNVLCSLNGVVRVDGQTNAKAKTEYHRFQILISHLNMPWTRMPGNQAAAATHFDSFND